MKTCIETELRIKIIVVFFYFHIQYYIKCILTLTRDFIPTRHNNDFYKLFYALSLFIVFPLKLNTRAQKALRFEKNCSNS